MSILAELSTERCAPIAGGGFAVFARAAETPPGSRLRRRRIGESARTNPMIQLFVRKRVRPCGGGFYRLMLLSLLSGSPNIASHAAVSSLTTVGCIMRIEMRRGRFALVCRDESSKSEITFAGRAGLTTGILRQRTEHSLANAKLGESFTMHNFTDIDQTTQNIIKTSPKHHQIVIKKS